MSNDEPTYEQLGALQASGVGAACEVCALWEPRLSTLRLAWELEPTTLCSECVAELGHGLYTPRTTTPSR